MAYQIISTSMIKTMDVEMETSHWVTTGEEILSIVPTGVSVIDRENLVEFTETVKRMFEDLYGPGHQKVSLLRAHKTPAGDNIEVVCTMVPPFERGGSWCKYLQERFTLKEM